MLKKDGKEVYPLQLNKIALGTDVCYDRSDRGKSWFIVDFWAGGGLFVPKGSDRLITADGSAFTISSATRTGGRIKY